MWLKRFLWRRVISAMARSGGFVDPLEILSRLENFAQPVEVKVPLELLRAGMLFHARGLLNTGAIQHNLDWIWPMWAVRQYNPHDPAFIPLAFSLTHINLTHRNWTAIGLPDLPELPIVDPSGLLTPFWDGWSLDLWLAAENGNRLYPSRLVEVAQRLETANGLAVITLCRDGSLEILSRAEVCSIDGQPQCRLTVTAGSTDPAWLVVALRPYNPEGVSFLPTIRLASDRSGWRLEHGRQVRFSEPAENWQFSNYRQGDVHTRLLAQPTVDRIDCKVGMATAAALFSITPAGSRRIEVNVPLSSSAAVTADSRSWGEAVRGALAASLPEEKIQDLFDAAVHTLILHSPGTIFPGPYTYRRFWFRDAAFILHALLCLGLNERTRRILDTFPSRQLGTGFFHSQTGEWDANGEALWIFHRYCRLTGNPPPAGWRRAVKRGTRWLQRKLLPATAGEPVAGLLPPGFSAEHLGPSDYYYWDDFWALSGLRAAADLLDRYGDRHEAAASDQAAEDLLRAIERSLALAGDHSGQTGMPASPFRRMDSGAIGSLAAGYPLQIFSPNDPRLLATATFLYERCLVDGGYFQSIKHSGINPYLTLHLAQVLLRSGDGRCFRLVRTVADLASPTGQWPEAVHPRTRGGCMGDGQHVWAAAEWVMWLRNAFLREEGDRLILASGIFPEWLRAPRVISFGPAPTDFGTVSLLLRPQPDGVEINWNAVWRGDPPVLEISLPGHLPIRPPAAASTIFLPHS